MKILAIDGNSIMNRAYYGIKSRLTGIDGTPTGALFGFMNIYLKIAEKIKPDCVAAAFDLHAPTFRHLAVESYKANRHGMDNELLVQMPLIKDILRLMGVTVIERQGFEADDILGTLSAEAVKSGNECVILTGDKDNLQLISENVKVMLAGNKGDILYDRDVFFEKYGFEPVNLIDLKALMGDSSDNIKGVKGVGEKTAMSLIQKWQTIENLYENLENAGVTKSVFAKLTAGKDDAFQSKWLATIKTDVPDVQSIEECRLKEPDSPKLLDLLKNLGMATIIEKLMQAGYIDLSENHREEEKKVYEVPEINAYILTENLLDKIILDSKPPEYLQLSFDVSEPELQNIFYILSDDLKKLYLSFENKIYTCDNEALILKFLCSDLNKVTFSAKNDYKLCFGKNLELKKLVFDCEIAGYLLDPSKAEYSIQSLCISNNIHYFSELAEFADIQALPELYFAMEKSISENNLESLMNDIEMPLTEVLASMEYYGIKADSDGIKKFGEGLKEKMSALEKNIYELAGKQFNILSPKQLGAVLFEDLNLPMGKKTKTGYSTNAQVLEELRGRHPIIEEILTYRQYSKLISTYVEGLLKKISDDGRIHTVFKQTETRTGRISSIEPNMQNIPVRTPLGRNMRKFFIADEGKILLDADYSQIELRIMSHMCGDENMQNAFINGDDIHTITAAKVFGVAESEVTAEMRSSAKAVNFGIIYGIGAFSLAGDINVSVKEADAYIKEYFNKYPKVKQYMDDTAAKCRENGYTLTLFGRKRYIPEIKSSNKVLQMQGRRIAINTSVQGTAADIIKIAMVKTYQKLKSENLNAHLILQVHDELIVESDKSSAERAGQILREEMENAVKLAVPLTADVNEGGSWYAAKG